MRQVLTHTIFFFRHFLVELSHFHLLRSVGKGAFGKVRVVQHKRTKEIYALKYINKAKCIRMRAVENIIQERRLLEEVEFSLICNLRYAFQDDENLFMVLDLMLGGDLRFHLERAGPMREDVVRFYIAELALALDALHERRIIHRYATQNRSVKCNRFHYRFCEQSWVGERGSSKRQLCLLIFKTVYTCANI